MIQPIGYNISQRSNYNTSFTGYPVFKDLQFNGKVLCDGKERVSRIFMMPLNSGKRLFLDYKDGLLRRSGLTEDGLTGVKKYQYTANDKLINVEKDGYDVFTKDCGYVDSSEIAYYESINRGVIELGYDISGRKITTVVKPKLIKSFFTYIENTINEMRYKITNVEVVEGNTWRIYPGEKGNFEIESKFSKRLSRNLHNGNMQITTYDGNNTTTTVEKDKFGDIISTIKTQYNKEEKPIWVIETDKYGNMIFQKYTNYDDAGNKISEKIFNKADGDFIKDITYDKNGKITMTQISDPNGNVYGTVKNTYNDFGNIINTKNIDANGTVTENEDFIYDKHGKLLESHYTGSGNEPEDIQEGDYYYKNGKIYKEIERFIDSIEESYCNKQGKLEKFNVKDSLGNLINSYTHKYNRAGKLKHTIKTDRNNNIVFTIDHSFKTKDIGEAHTKIYNDPNGNFVIREVIITTETGTKSIYLDNEGKIINPAPYLNYIYG